MGDREISVVVLAGGGSRRMGKDKANLVLDVDDTHPISMIDRVLDHAAHLSLDIVVVGRALECTRSVARSIPDVVSGMGPLGGVLAGLRAIQHDRCLLLACDMPFVNVVLARQMIALDSKSDVLAIASGSRVEPFHAIYQRHCLAAAESVFSGKNRSLGKFLKALDCDVVPTEMVDALDPERWCLFNVNTPADFELARRHARDTRGKTIV